MRCRLFLKATGREATVLGPYAVCSRQEAVRLAHALLAKNSSAEAVDIWWQSGELMRVNRPPEALLQAAIEKDLAGHGHFKPD